MMKKTTTNVGDGGPALYGGEDVVGDGLHSKTDNVSDDQESGTSVTTSSGVNNITIDDVTSVSSLRSKLRVIYCLQLLEIIAVAFILPGILSANVQESDCCGEPMKIGLVSKIAAYSSLAILMLQIITWVSCCSATANTNTTPEEDGRDDLGLAKHAPYAINWMTYINLYLIAIATCFSLYMKNKTECYILLAVMGYIHLMHLICCIYYNTIQVDNRSSNCTTCCCTLSFHGTSIIPFITIVSMVLMYLQTGGMCYVVNDRSWSFTGCQMCVGNGDDWAPPTVDNICFIKDPTHSSGNASEAYTTETFELDLNPFNYGAPQDTSCFEDDTGGYNYKKFCFFTA